MLYLETAGIWVFVSGLIIALIAWVKNSDLYSYCGKLLLMSGLLVVAANDFFEKKQIGFGIITIFVSLICVVFGIIEIIMNKKTSQKENKQD